LACRSRRDRISSNVPSSAALRSATSRSRCEAMIEPNPQRLSHSLTHRQRAVSGSKSRERERRSSSSRRGAGKRQRPRAAASSSLSLLRSLPRAPRELSLSHKAHRPSRPPRLHERRPNTNTYTHDLSIHMEATGAQVEGSSSRASRGWTIAKPPASATSSPHDLKLISPRARPNTLSTPTATTKIESMPSSAITGEEGEASRSSTGDTEGAVNRTHSAEGASEKRDPHHVVARGWLTKQGGSIKTWKKRYFTLSSLALTYSTSSEVHCIHMIERDAQLTQAFRAMYIDGTISLSISPAIRNQSQNGVIKGTIRLADVDNIVAGGETKRGFEFMIETKARTYRLVADTEKRRLGWIDRVRAQVRSRGSKVPYTNTHLSLFWNQD